MMTNTRTSLYIGCGPSPIHPQHLVILGDPSEWTFVDLYVKELHIKNWDAKVLREVEIESVDTIYSSHTLEHFEHSQVLQILTTWHQKLKPKGTLILNVPDLIWALKRLNQWEQGAFLDGYYDQIAGEHGILSILYGSQSHEGEYHKGGFTKRYLQELLEKVGFTDITIEQREDAHNMQVLIARCNK